VCVNICDWIDGVGHNYEPESFHLFIHWINTILSPLFYSLIYSSSIQYKNAKVFHLCLVFCETNSFPVPKYSELHADAYGNEL
jgi:hypothetical protein